MKTIISERLSQIIKELGINKNKLAIELGYKNSVVGNVVNQRNLPSFDFLVRLKQFENRINMNWLIAGEGSIFVDENKNSDDHEKLDVYKDLIDTLKRENILLRDKIEQKNFFKKHTTRLTIVYKRMRYKNDSGTESGQS